MRIAVVTGGGRGIGRAIALALARDGWAVGVLDLAGESASAVAQEIVSAGGQAVGLAADVTDLPAIQAACEAVERDLGPIGALVNNAGWDTLARFADGPPDLWDHIIDVNLKGALNANPEALATWGDITPLARNEWICWIESAKKPETRSKRINWGCSSLEEGKRRPCCWPGCRHR